jgi:hypothetical protein
MIKLGESDADGPNAAALAGHSISQGFLGCWISILDCDSLI